MKEFQNTGKSGVTRRYNSALVLFFFSAAVFIGGAAVKFHTPLVEWDYLCVLQASVWAKGGKFFFPDHPPLYPFLLSFFSGHPGSIALYRCFNFVGVSLTAFLLYFFSRKYLERGLCLAAVAFYLLTPAVIQGVSVLDYADTSWLPLAFLLLFRLAASLSSGFSLPVFLGSAAAAVLCLCFKITSSIALFLAILIYWFAGSREVKKAFLPVLAALAAGALIFALGWKAAGPYLFSGGFAPDPWSIAGNTVLSRIVSAFSPESAAKWLVYLGLTLFWFSPVFLALLAGPLLKRRARAEIGAPSEIRFFYFAGLLYFISYFLVGGLNHGFPRYQMSVWPLMAFLAVFGSRDALGAFLEKDLAKTAVAAGLAAIPGVLFLPDPLRLLNLGLKEAMVTGFGLWKVAAGLAAVLAFYAALAWGSSRRAGSGAAASLMTVALAYYLITDLSQLNARYLTSYEYGTAGKAELAAELRVSVPEEAAIFATPGLLYYIRPGKDADVGQSDWVSVDSVRAAVSVRSPEIIIAGPGSNTLWQLRLFLYDPALAGVLRDNYDMRQAGTFRVWRKRKPVEKN